MSNFRRTRSKVWWSNFIEEKDEDENKSKISWQQTSQDNSRGSTSSPSNGSHKSQDSGFSDSESSGNKSENAVRNKKVEKEKTFPIIDESPTRIPRPSLLPRNKNKGKKVKNNDNNLAIIKSQCSSISNYLAECYFPICEFSNKNNNNNNDHQDNNNLSLNSIENRTCFIVDEIPKKINSQENSINDDSSKIIFPNNFQNKIKIQENYQIKEKFQDNFQIQDNFRTQGNFQIQDNFRTQGNFQIEEKKSQENYQLKEKFQDNFQIKEKKFQENFQFQNNQQILDNFKIQEEKFQDNFSSQESIKKKDYQIPEIENRDKFSEKKVRFYNSSYRKNDSVNKSLFQDNLSQNRRKYLSNCIGHEISNNFSDNFLDENDNKIPNLENRLENLEYNKCLTNDTSFSSSLNSEHFEVFAQSSTPKKSNCKINFENVTNNDLRINDHGIIEWKNELRLKYEPECLITLQSKPICSSEKRAPFSFLSVCEMEGFQNSIQIIQDECVKLYRLVGISYFDQAISLAKSLTSHLLEFLFDNTRLMLTLNKYDNEQLLQLMNLCDHVKIIIERLVPDKNIIMDDINDIIVIFNKLIDSLLNQQANMLITILRCPIPEAAMLTAIARVTGLSKHVPRMNDLIIKYDIIDCLLNLCIQSPLESIRSASLRSLATLCSNTATLRQLEKNNGIEMLSSLLCDETKSEEELSDIVSLLVQITAPWLEDNQRVKGLSLCLKPIISALTALLRNTNSCEILLLVAAGLANISFLEQEAIWTLLEENTAGYLISIVKNLGTRASVFIQEQTATLIANMSAVPETRPHLAKHRAVVALLCFLQMTRSPLQSPSEKNAAARLQHKSAIALSRLCSDMEVCKQIIELRGVARLVRLCREQRERNYSDGVLVACLAALRKITSNCGNSAIEELDARELVEPRLVDSFLLYSSKEESYV